MNEVKYSDGNEMVNAKIMRNDLTVKMLNIQKRITENEIAKQKIANLIIDAKIKIINSMTRLERMQINSYDKDRESTINDQVVEMNTIGDVWTEQISSLVKSSNALQTEHTALMEEFIKIIEKIPEHGVVTNYRMVID